MALPITDALARAFRRSVVRMSHRVELIQGSDVIASTDNGTIKVTDCGISYDETREWEGECRISAIVDEATAELIPTSSTSVLSPITPTAIRVTPGAKTWTGEVEGVTVGTFDLAETDIVEDRGGLTFTATAYGAERAIGEAVFHTLTYWPAGQNILELVETLITGAIPNAVVDYTPMVALAPMVSYDIGDSRREAIDSLLASIGYDMRVDPFRVFELQPTDTSEASTWVFAEGVDGTRVLRANRRLTDQGVYNGVIVRGESFGTDAPPVTGSVWDLDPESPTYYDPLKPTESSYGPRPLVIHSEYATNIFSAVAMATTEFRKLKGLSEIVTIETALNPAIQVGDVCLFQRPRVGADGQFIVQSLDYSFAMPRMMITMRERRL